MNSLQALEGRLREQFPTAKLELSRPAREDGIWILDAVHRGNALVIQWQPGGLFGLSSLEDHGYGEKPAEVFKELDGAETRAVALLKSGGRTKRPAAVTLRGLRAELNLTQEQLATE
jgi:hypothetical protein